MSVSNKDIKTGDKVLINWRKFNKFAPNYLNPKQLEIFDYLEKNDCEFCVTGLAMGHAYIIVNFRFPDYVDIIQMEVLLPQSLLHKIYESECQ